MTSEGEKQPLKPDSEKPKKEDMEFDDATREVEPKDKDKSEESVSEATQTRDVYMSKEEPEMQTMRWRAGSKDPEDYDLFEDETTDLTEEQKKMREKKMSARRKREALRHYIASVGDSRADTREVAEEGEKQVYRISEKEDSVLQRRRLRTVREMARIRTAAYKEKENLARLKIVQAIKDEGARVEEESKLVRDVAVGFGFNPSLAGTLVQKQRCFIIAPLPKKGAMSDVYKGRLLAFGDLPVVVKAVLNTPDTSERSIRRTEEDAKILANLHSWHAVRIRDGEFSLREYGVYYIMDQVKGDDLDTIMENRLVLEPKMVVKIALDVLEVLEEVHQRGIAHRDVKPSNIIQQEENEFILIDFGVAKPIEVEVEKQKHLRSAARLVASEKTRPDDLQVLGIEEDLHRDIVRLIEEAKRIGIEEFLHPRFEVPEGEEDRWSRLRQKHKKFFRSFQETANKLQRLIPTTEESTGTRAGARVGTPLYMSVEQATGDDVTTKSDIFSLCSTLYYLLSGDNLYAGDTYDVLIANIARYQHVPLKEKLAQSGRQQIADHPAEIIEWGLARFPKDRPTAAEMRLEFGRYLRGLGPSPKLDKYCGRQMKLPPGHWAAGLLNKIKFWRKKKK